jgi:hypothetical protein
VANSTTNVVVTFSEAMDASTINATNINLRVTSSGASVAGAVTYNAAAHTATFTPNSTLATAVSYTFTVLGAVKDLAGNQMGTNFQSTFTTADLTPPTVRVHDAGESRYRGAGRLDCHCDLQQADGRDDNHHRNVYAQSHGHQCASGRCSHVRPGKQTRRPSRHLRLLHR